MEVSMVKKSSIVIFLMLLLLITLGCSPAFVELSDRVIYKYALSKEDLKSIQYFSSIDKSIEFQAKEKTSKEKGINLKEGTLFSKIQTERNYISIPKATMGIAKELEYKKEQRIPASIQIQFDKTLPPITYIFVPKKNKYIYYGPGLEYNGLFFENIRGDYTYLWVKQSDINRIVKNRKIAKGIKIKNETQKAH